MPCTNLKKVKVNLWTHRKIKVTNKNHIFKEGKTHVCSYMSKILSFCGRETSCLGWRSFNVTQHIVIEIAGKSNCFWSSPI